MTDDILLRMAGTRVRKNLKKIKHKEFLEIANYIKHLQEIGYSKFVIRKMFLKNNEKY